MMKASPVLMLGAAVFALVAGTAMAEEPRVAAPGVVTVPGTDKPSPGAFDLPEGAPRHAADLPDGTPADLEGADASVPLTRFVDALRRSYWTSPTLIAERARARSSDYRLPQARAEFGPQLSYAASYGYQRDNTQLAIGSWFDRAGWTTTATAVLAQPLFTFGRLRAGEDMARAEIAHARASLRSREQDVLFAAIASYAGVLRDRAGVAIAADNLSLLAREYKDSQSRLAARESTATDVQQVELRLELARAQLLSAERTQGASEASFLRYVGAPAGELDAPNPLTLPTRTLEEAYAYADQHNPLLAAAYARERISRAALAAARADLLPRVDLRGSASYGAVTPYSDSLRQTELRGSVTVSGTIDSGIRQARIGEASAANDADWRLIDSVQRDLRAELADAWNEWQTQTASIERLRRAVDAAQKAYDGAVEQERAGMRTTLDVLELARDLLQVRSNHNSASTAAYLAQARMLAAMGVLDKNYLLPDEPGYDAEANLARIASHGDIPLVTPLVRAIDGLASGGQDDRALRDPAAGVAIAAVKPAAEAVPAGQ